MFVEFQSNKKSQSQKFFGLTEMTYKQKDESDQLFLNKKPIHGKNGKCA